MAMEVQRIWRCRLGCLQFAMERVVRERSAIVIQIVWRLHHPVIGTRAPSRLRQRLDPASEVSSFDNNNTVRRSMAKEMQRIWRCRLGCLQFAMERVVRERSAIVIQIVWRLHHSLQTLLSCRHVAIQLQSRWRSVCSRFRYTSSKSSAAKVGACIRGFVI